MKLGKGFASGCRSASGDFSDRNKTSCRAFNGDICNFDSGVVCNNTVDGISFVVDATATGIPFDRCLFVGQGLTQIEMTYVCLTSGNMLSTCSNNCLGVEASDIIAEETALLAVSAAGAVGQQR